MTERDNESRLGIAGVGENGDIQPPAVVLQQQKGLEFVSPTELVDLPSEGKYYPAGHPLNNKKDLEIRYMTAKEEDILTSKSLLKKGIAIDRMLESLLVDKTIKLDELLLGDKNALILAARKSGYGPRYDTQMQCPKCEAKAKYTFNLDNIKNKEIQEIEGVEITSNGTFLITLPKTQLKVEVKPITGKDEKTIAETQDEKKKSTGAESLLTTQMKLFTVSVNGNNNKQEISKIIDKMPAMDARHLREVYKKLVPDVNMTQLFVCKTCDHEEVVEIPLTTEFFWPNG